MKQTEILVSVIIPCFNNRQLLERYLSFLIKASKYPGNRICEIILVDDASSDDSMKYVKKNHPEVRIIKHKINRGFATTVNTGVRMSKGSLCVLLNTDVAPQENFVESAIKLFNDDKLFGVSFNEGVYGWNKGIFKNGFIIHEPGTNFDKVHSTFWVSGGSSIIRRDIWMELGGFDENLLSPFYWEDVDISYRSLKRGYKLLWDPGAKVFHQHEGTVSKLNQRFVNLIQERNQLLFIWKNLTSKPMFRVHLKFLFKKLLMHPGYIRVVINALKKHKQLNASRRTEIKEAKVSDEAIFASFK